MNANKNSFYFYLHFLCIKKEIIFILLFSNNTHYKFMLRKITINVLV